ncbi:MAG: hypothetical protein VYC39_08945 [Myxococcota bacterium]|nr:hypothetical protein [Myxococcota bacterium]
MATIGLDAAEPSKDAEILIEDAEVAPDALSLDAQPADLGVADAGIVPDAGTDYCEGSGPPIFVGDTTELCSNQLAVTTFRYALCLCDGHTASAPVSIDAFDSTEGLFSDPELGGSIGVNGRIQANAGYSATGSLWVSSEGGITSSLPMNIMADLNNQGPMSGQSDLTVGNNAKIGGPVELRDLVVGSTLTVPQSENVNVTGNFSYQSFQREPVQVEPPCDCEPDELVDIAGYVQYHANNNDNDMAGIAKDALDGFTETTTISIDCGRIYFSRILGTGPLHINVSGRTAIFVSGEVNLPDGFSISLGPDAELDLFIEGHLVSSKRVVVGNPAAPSSTRLYLGGQGSFLLSSNSVISANVYAPEAELVTSGTLEVFGSLFLRRLNTSSPVNIHYDKGVLKKAESCPDDVSTNECETCRDCLNQACIAGQCGECRNNDDCCSPLFCQQGVCVPFSL